MIVSTLSELARKELPNVSGVWVKPAEWTGAEHRIQGGASIRGRMCLMDWQLSGKRAFVTAGANGIGEAIANLLASEGASVVVADTPVLETVYANL